MLQKKKILLNLFISVIGITSYGQEKDSLYTNIDYNLSSADISLTNLDNTKKESVDLISFSLKDTVTQKKDSIIYPPASKDYRKLGYNTCLFVGVTITAFAILYTMPESVTNWNKEEMKNGGMFKKWEKNVKTGPVFDHDSPALNFIAHPYCGAIYYMSARGCGFNIVESFTYSFLMSTLFWEYGVEAFAEKPSIQDLIVTPIVGSVLGEGFSYGKKAILQNDKEILHSKFLGTVSLFLLDPFNTIVDGLGYKQRVKTQASVGMIGFSNNTISPIFGINFTAKF